LVCRVFFVILLICIVFLRTIEKLVVTNDGEDSNRRDRDQLSSRGVQLKSPWWVWVHIQIKEITSDDLTLRHPLEFNARAPSHPLPVNHERAAIVTGNADVFGRLVPRAA